MYVMIGASLHVMIDIGYSLYSMYSIST